MIISGMPKLDFLKDILTADEYELARGIVATRGKNKGCLRASKPPVKRHDLGVNPDSKLGFHLWQIDGGDTAYIWRMVAFFASPISQHNCMPCTADFDVNGDTYQDRLARMKELDKIMDHIPAERWHGVARWQGLL